MARYIGPKDKLSRREGFDLFNKGSKLRKAGVAPGAQGKRRAGKQTEYGKQLRSKQRAKRFYGILEKQFRNYVKRASRVRANTSEVLVSLLEKRLDNVVFRLGFAPTRPAARQFVNHGLVLVNGLKTAIPSYELKTGDTITITEKLENIPYVAEHQENKPIIPEWLERDNNKGRVVREPGLADLSEPISVSDIIEFYSR